MFKVPNAHTGQGFSEAIAEKFLAEGAKVVLADFAEDIGGKAAKEPAQLVSLVLS